MHLMRVWCQDKDKPPDYKGLKQFIPAMNPLFSIERMFVERTL
ncbi:protein of unknown function [Vibrio tapetis subsp. tapetis]|uniref:Uncharacterized protein n=1 Tax=Vibrio tapetis subsp. tapetis TaxID=1671868 RepID=A0A2N8ZB65_9VIBR|nr:protein of unknown function [Vibrio tapetis subsp. tapetis]